MKQLLLALLMLFTGAASAGDIVVSLNGMKDAAGADLQPFSFTISQDTLVASVLEKLPNPFLRDPVYLLPGDVHRALSPDGAQLSLGPNGEVYKDGVQLVLRQADGSTKPVAVAKLLTYGMSVYGLGQTDGKWYKWTGVGWATVANPDPAVFK